MDWLVWLFFLPWLALKLTVSAVIWYVIFAAIKGQFDSDDARGWWYGFKDNVYDLWWDIRRKVKTWFGRS